MEECGWHEVLSWLGLCMPKIPIDGVRDCLHLGIASHRLLGVCRREEGLRAFLRNRPALFHAITDRRSGDRFEQPRIFVRGKGPFDLTGFLGIRELCTVTALCRNTNRLAAPALKCPGCFRALRRISLPCGHRICGGCVHVEDWDGYRCPVCQRRPSDWPGRGVDSLHSDSDPRTTLSLSLPRIVDDEDMDEDGGGGGEDGDSEGAETEDDEDVERSGLPLLLAALHVVASGHGSSRGSSGEAGPSAANGARGASNGVGSSGARAQTRHGDTRDPDAAQAPPPFDVQGIQGHQPKRWTTAPRLPLVSPALQTLPPTVVVIEDCEPVLKKARELHVHSSCPTTEFDSDDEASGAEKCIVID